MSELVLGPNFPRARCAEVDPELFFPTGDGSKAAIREAKLICARCPHVFDCLDYALREPAGAHGVWGGTTETQRRRIRTVERISARRRPAHYALPSATSHQDTA